MAACALAWLARLFDSWNVPPANATATLRVDEKPYISQPNHLKTTNDPLDQPTFALKVDNKGAIDISHAAGPKKRTKHIDFKYHSVQQKVRGKALSLEKVLTLDQRADFLKKKPQARSISGSLRRKLLLTLSVSSEGRVAH